ncbi:MAG: DUF262 domain-containing protein [Chlorobium sp.]|jgi:uncharacterized protein with ParB-like and HNH nuclease domain|nr:DUF262 domain-containing protein [Chlorobium sp.]
MSYLSISVKEAINKLNGAVNGWFLPAIQRPYVWGSRYENEMYICKLFDSIMRGYPIGGLIVWNTEEEIPYREFITDYHQFGNGSKLTEKGLWKRNDKWLVYDGQQRLQTLFSCLRYTFNEKILVFNLLFNKTKDRDPDETGFFFVEKNSVIEWNYLRLNELFIKKSDENKKHERELLKKAGGLSESDEELVCKNLGQLLKIFVETDKKSLSYFPITTSDESEVNEIFERLNSGGISLSLSDLLFSKIKEPFPFFEENLQTASKDIYNKTGKGFSFNAYNILQLINLLVKGQVRVDPKKVKQVELSLFNEKWKQLEKPLEAFFTDYIWGQFKINNAAIIPRNITLLPIIVYFYEIYSKGYSFKNITKSNLDIINKYFIKSQINDWSLQSFIDNFAIIINTESATAGKELFEFPLSQIEAKVNEQKKRQTDIYEESFVDYSWFALKVLTPNRIYQFEPDIHGRFNPEIDHIFPRNPKDKTMVYANAVDIIWNMQPTKGDINGYKTNHHPKLFFTDKAVNANGEIIHGSKYIHEYDFLFPKTSENTIDLINNIWNTPIDFIKFRRTLMINYLKDTYGITLIEKKGVN